jgi:hypothetical protein
MTTQSPPGTPGQPGTTISLSFVPSVLAWNGDDTRLDTAAGLLASGSDDGTHRADTWGNQ